MIWNQFGVIWYDHLQHHITQYMLTSSFLFRNIKWLSIVNSVRKHIFSSHAYWQEGKIKKDMHMRSNFWWCWPTHGTSPVRTTRKWIRKGESQTINYFIRQWVHHLKRPYPVRWDIPYFLYPVERKLKNYRMKKTR